MEQGTGKTLVTISFFQYLLEEHQLDRYLIICPLSVMDVWQTQLAQHWEDPPPIRPVLRWRTHANMPTGPSVTIVNYERLMRMREMFWRQEYDVVVVDESHRIKNHASKQSKAVAKLKAPIRMILTGTPIGNNPMDLFGQFRFLDPAAFGATITPFRSKFCYAGGFMGTKWKMRGDKVRDALRIVNRYAFRVTNKVLGLPPERPPVLRYFELGHDERKAYDDLVTDMVHSSDDFSVTTPLVVSQLMKLRQITGGFVKDDEGANQRLGDSKLSVLRDYLKNDLPPGEVFVVFCVFRQEIEEVVKLLRSMKFKPGVIHGDVPVAERARVTRALGQSFDCVVCQGAAGGVGIDLTAASMAVFYSVDFSFINYYQARARIHRHGQTKSTTYLHLIAKKTIDGDCYSALLDKADVAREALAYLRKEHKRHGR